jgi:hypothetical protein
VEIDLFKDPLPGTANGDSFRSLRKPLSLKSLGYPFAPHEGHRALGSIDSAAMASVRMHQ